MNGFGYRLSKKQVKRFKFAKKIMGSNLNCKFDMRDYIHIEDGTKLNSINTQVMYEKTKDQTGHENMNHFLNSYNCGTTLCFGGTLALYMIFNQKFCTLEDERWLKEATIAEIMEEPDNIKHFAIRFLGFDPEKEQESKLLQPFFISAPFYGKRELKKVELKVLLKKLDRVIKTRFIPKHYSTF